MGMDNVKAREDTITAIKCAVALFFGMPVECLQEKSTARSVTVPRQIAMYLVRQMTGASLPEIGRHFGGKHNRTVMASIAKVDKQRRTKDDVDLVIRILEKNIGVDPVSDGNV